MFEEDRIYRSGIIGLGVTIQGYQTEYLTETYYTFDLGGYCTGYQLGDRRGSLRCALSPSAGYNDLRYLSDLAVRLGKHCGGELFFSLSRMYGPPLLGAALGLRLTPFTGSQVFRNSVRFSGRGEGAIRDGSSCRGLSVTKSTPRQGPSQITAQFKTVGTTKGDDILITGIVTDISPAQNQAVRQRTSPQGVPCVAFMRVSDWMELVWCNHVQQRDQNPVCWLSLLNGNYRTISTATTDTRLDSTAVHGHNRHVFVTPLCQQPEPIAPLPRTARGLMSQTRPTDDR